MYFLEELAAQWYAYNGYFVRTNVKFGKRPKGGYEGEMDLVAFHPTERKLVHLEASTDAESWRERLERFDKKFRAAEAHYKELFPFDHERIEKVVVVGFGRTHPKAATLNGVTFWSIPEFLNQISSALKRTTPMEEAISEQWPLLRAIKWAFWAGEPD